MSSLLRWQILEAAGAIDERQRRLTEGRNRRQVRQFFRRNYDPFSYLSDDEFHKTFRLDKETVRSLAEELTPYLRREHRSDGIPIMTRILTALAFYASGSYQTLVGQSAFHHLSQKSVSRSIRQVTDALNRIYQSHIKWPTQREERNRLKSMFHEKFGFPGVIGCIDGTHVALIRPRVHEERYYNRKGFHSLNVMIICDAELNILCVDASYPGAAHDSSVWQSHPLNQHLNDISNSGEEVFLLGDSGYPLRKTMMTPILDTVEGTREHHYYMSHVTARNTVERCIGVLKARFRCLLSARALHYSPQMAGKIVNACCVLHNVAIRTGAPVPSVVPEGSNTGNQREQQEEHLRAETEDMRRANDPRNRRVNPDLLEGRALRQALVDMLWRNRRN